MFVVSQCYNYVNLSNLLGSALFERFEQFRALTFSFLALLSAKQVSSRRIIMNSGENVQFIVFESHSYTYCPNSGDSYGSLFSKKKTNVM